MPAEEPPRRAAATQDAYIAVKGFRIVGSAIFSEAELLPLLRDGIGKDLPLDLLNELVHRITAWYRSHGYLLAKAYLPAQEVRDGIVEVAVLEGRLGAVRLENASGVAEGVIADHLAGLSNTAVIANDSMERPLLLLGDLPGVEVRSSLKPGATFGTSDLDIKVTGKERVSGSVDGDNYGSRYSGELRAGFTVNLANPLGRGDLLNLRGTVADGMRYGRFSWQLPVGGDGLKFGAAWSEMRYALDKEFAPLRAHGTADIATFWASFPFLREQSANINGQASLDRKKLEDRVDATLTVSDKLIDVATLSLTGDWVDGMLGGGVNNGSVSLTRGRLRLDALTGALDRATLRTEGGYEKLAANFSRLQALAGGLTLYASFSGQAAAKNLDSSEKLSLGGPQAVRAYPQGEAAGDDAWLASVELRWSLPGLRNVEAVGFYDAGRSRINHSPLSYEIVKMRRLAGQGIGLQWYKMGDFALRSYLAWRAGAKPSSDVDRSPRGWIQLAKYF